MGYYTAFGISFEGEMDKIQKAEQDFKDIDKELEELIEDGGSYMKWYNWETDCKSVAEKNPDVLILLEGDGEESDDTWEARFKGTQYEYHEVVMPPFTNEALFTASERINAINNPKQ